MAWRVYAALSAELLEKLSTLADLKNKQQANGQEFRYA